jgi:hypothetical protein
LGKFPVAEPERERKKINTGTGGAENERTQNTLHVE